MDQISYNDYGQATSIRIGGGSANPLTEQYSFDANTGLMTNQKVKRGATSLMDLTYEYNRGSSNGSINGTTGNLTHIVNNLDRNKDRVYEYDTLGRLIKAKGGAATGVGGVTANWTQDYAYDRYGNKTTTTKSGITANSAAIPLDGLASQTYTAATNRITNLSHEYDNSGNMTRGASPDGILQRFEYDEAGRIKIIKTDAGAAIETNTYATSRERLIKENATERTYYAWGGSSVLAEFTEAFASSTPSWAKSNIYAGSRLLSTITKNGAAELTEYHHPDRLGTKAVSDTTANTFKEQATLPFGAMIDAETVASTNQKFTSYDRSGATGLDYAVNRTYNSGQSRFTQVDPIGMASASIGDPQSMNLFAYTRNNPVDFVDPSGLNLSSTQYSCTTTRIWGHWEDANGNITGYSSYSSTVCQSGGGGGGGGAAASGNANPPKRDICQSFNNLLKNPIVKAAFDQAWGKSGHSDSKVVRERNATEQGGIIIGNGDNFKPYERRDSENRFELEFSSVFIKDFQDMGFDVTIFYHTHPFEEGDRIYDVNGVYQGKQGRSNSPSDGDKGFIGSITPAIAGVVITSTHYVLFGPTGARCEVEKGN